MEIAENGQQLRQSGQHYRDTVVDKRVGNTPGKKGFAGTGGPGQKDSKVFLFALLPLADVPFCNIQPGVDAPVIIFKSILPCLLVQDPSGPHGFCSISCLLFSMRCFFFIPFLGLALTQTVHGIGLSLMRDPHLLG